MDLNVLAKELHDTAKSKGWYKGERNKAELIALIHAELSEALEELRNGHLPKEIYFKTVTESLEPQIMGGSMSGEKPEGFPIEIADVIIRILDMCAYLEVDIEEAIKIKMEYNKTRAYRHGNKEF